MASRQAGYWVAGFLCVFGLLPPVGGWMAIMPSPVLGGVTLMLFGLVAAAGMRILRQAPLRHREMVIVGLALAMGLGVQAVPEVLQPLPAGVQTVFRSAITAGGLTAIVLNAVIPRDSTDRSGEAG